MNKPTKWSLIGLGIFVLVVIVAVSIFFISSAVVAAAMEGFSNTIVEQVKKEIPEALTEPEIREIIREEIAEVQNKEEVASDEAPLEEEKEITGEEGISEELETGQEFIYQGRKIILTKYEIVETNIDKNLLWVYLYVENIGNVPHEHINDCDFIIYHKGRKAEPLFGGFGPEEGRKGYDIGSYDKLYPGEVCEGWISNYISTGWKAEDIEIRFEPLFGGTECIWKLK